MQNYKTVDKPCKMCGLVCSVCGEYLDASDEYEITRNYCPSCGAKMDAPDHE